jgi:hypothetical protein
MVVRCVGVMIGRIVVPEERVTACLAVLEAVFHAIRKSVRGRGNIPSCFKVRSCVEVIVGVDHLLRPLPVITSWDGSQRHKDVGYAPNSSAECVSIAISLVVMWGVFQKPTFLSWRSQYAILYWL